MYSILHIIYEYKVHNVCCSLNLLPVSVNVYGSFVSVSVTDIKGFVTGRDCPHVKDKKDKAKTVSDCVLDVRKHK